MTRWLPALLCAALTASAAQAADGQGRFAIRGAGLLTCATYVEERAAQSKAYYVVGGWLDGYITALNQFAPDTYDVTTFESTELLALLIDEHCKKHPDDRLFPVANTIFTMLREDRLRAPSASVAVKVGDRQTQLYREVVSRAQRELSRRGVYRGPADGKFSPAVQQALTTFQRQQKLNASGFPDQATLWRLFRPSPGTR
jgi:hypothetical protein